MKQYNCINRLYQQLTWKPLCQMNLRADIKSHWMSVDAAEAWSSTGEEFNQEHQTAEK